MSQQTKTPDEELAIALERCLNRWKAKEPRLESVVKMISNGTKILESFKESGEFSELDRFRVKSLVSLSNAKIIQS